MQGASARRRSLCPIRGGRTNVAIAGGALLLVMLVPAATGSAGAATAAAAHPAVTASVPGTPGTPQSPTVLYSENFEHGQGTAWLRAHLKNHPRLRRLRLQAIRKDLDA